MELISCEDMKKLEKLSDENGVSYKKLMINAGNAVAAFIDEKFRDISGMKVLICCGCGNNGGDGFVTAEALKEKGAAPTVILTSTMPASEEAKAMYERIVECGIPIISFLQDEEKCISEINRADIIVDAIFGTGFHGDIEAPLSTLIERINSCGKIVVSIDIPSGVNARTGEVSKECVEANYTLTFEAKKYGHILLPGREYCGDIITALIGIPEIAYEHVDDESLIMNDEMVFSAIKKRPRYSNKGTFGRLVNIAGSREFKGAAILSTLGALRMGAGIVTAVATEPISNIILTKCPEATICSLAQDEDGMIDISDEKSAENLENAIKRANAVLIGCGIGRKKSIEKLVAVTAKNSEANIIFDADALYAISNNLDILKMCKKTPILTPHMGEMARLCGISIEQLRQDKVKIAKDFAKEYRVVLVLKDASTIVVTPKGDAYFSVFGNPGLAKGGSGDVLAGIVGSLMAQGLIPVAAAVAGVYLHGIAADSAAKEMSEYGMLPSDIPLYLCRLLSEKGL